MAQLILNENDYRIYRSQLIVDNFPSFVTEARAGVRKIQKLFGVRTDSTRFYWGYNAFAATSGNLLFYQLYLELMQIIRDYVGHNDPLWFECWINSHNPNEVLKWHNHEWPLHGYVSIDPKDTVTVFKDYKIENKIGNIYIGPGNRPHTVEVNQKYPEPRITLGFDVCGADRMSDGVMMIPVPPMALSSNVHR